MYFEQALNDQKDNLIYINHKDKIIIIQSLAIHGVIQMKNFIDKCKDNPWHFLDRTLVWLKCLLGLGMIIVFVSIAFSLLGGTVANDISALING